MTIPHSIWEGIASTSFWFYYLFLVLVYFGLQTRKPRVQRLANPAILPVAFFFLSGVCFFLLPTTNSYLVLSWFGLLCFGTALGWLQGALFRVKPLPDHRHIYIAGSNRFLIFLACLAIGWLIYLGTGTRLQPLLDPQLILSEPYLSYIVLAYGLTTGLAIGRSLRLIYTLKHGPFYDGPLSAKLP